MQVWALSYGADGFSVHLENRKWYRYAAEALYDHFVNAIDHPCCSTRPNGKPTIWHRLYELMPEMARDKAMNDPDGWTDEQWDAYRGRVRDARTPREFLANFGSCVLNNRLYVYGMKSEMDFRAPITDELAQLIDPEFFQECRDEDEEDLTKPVS